VFETVLVLDGRPVAWRRHRERLATSCRDLYGAPLEDGLDRRVAALSGGVRRGRLRVVATPVDEGAVIVTAQVAPLRPRGGAPLLTPVLVPRGYGRHKLVDRGWLERLEASVPAGARPLLVTAAGGVLETTRANVFAVRGGGVQTPPLDGEILPGVIRAVLLEEARRLGLAVHEEPLALAALREADAVVLTGSLRVLEWRALRGGGGDVVRGLTDAVAQWAERDGAAGADGVEVAGRPDAE